MPHLKEVARAYAEDDPNLRTIAGLHLREIEDELKEVRVQLETRLSDLQREGDLIRQIVAFGLPYSPPIPDSTPTMNGNFAGLSDSEKELVNMALERLALENLGASTEDVMRAAYSANVPINNRVKYPGSVVGAMWRHAKERVRAGKQTYPAERRQAPVRPVGQGVLPGSVALDPSES